jgi:hypothetical protein
MGDNMVMPWSHFMPLAAEILVLITGYFILGQVEGLSQRKRKLLPLIVGLICTPIILFISFGEILVVNEVKSFLSETDTIRYQVWKLDQENNREGNELCSGELHEEMKHSMLDGISSCEQIELNHGHGFEGYQIELSSEDGASVYKINVHIHADEAGRSEFNLNSITFQWGDGMATGECRCDKLHKLLLEFVRAECQQAAK